MATTESPRNKQLARIHIGAQRLGLIRPGDDGAYRDMLWSIARVRSARDLDHAGRDRVIRHLVGCGADIGPRQRSSASRTTRYDKGTQPALIRHLWTMLAASGAVRDGSDRAMRRWLARYAKAHAQAQKAITEVAPQHLTAYDAHDAIENLKQWCARVSITDTMIRDGEIPTPGDTTQ